MENGQILVAQLSRLHLSLSRGHQMREKLIVNSRGYTRCVDFSSCHPATRGRFLIKWHEYDLSARGAPRDIRKRDEVVCCCVRARVNRQWWPSDWPLAAGVHDSPAQNFLSISARRPSLSIFNHCCSQGEICLLSCLIQLQWSCLSNALPLAQKVMLKLRAECLMRDWLTSRAGLP